MKIKQNLFITDTKAFLNGDYDYCFHLSSPHICCAGWVSLGEIELDINVTDEEVTAACLATLDAAEAKAKEEYEAKMADILRHRADLMGIAYQQQADENNQN